VQIDKFGWGFGQCGGESRGKKLDAYGGQREGPKGGGDKKKQLG